MGAWRPVLRSEAGCLAAGYCVSAPYARSSTVRLCSHQRGVPQPARPSAGWHRDVLAKDASSPRQVLASAAPVCVLHSHASRDGGRGHGRSVRWPRSPVPACCNRAWWVCYLRHSYLLPISARARRNMGLSRNHLLSALISIGLSACVSSASVARQEPDCVMRQVVDGDTFNCRDGRKVRLTGIDTPERE